MTAAELARRVIQQPLTPERVGKFVRHLQSTFHFEQVLAAVADETERARIRDLAGPAVQAKFR
jgi:hypothetical protein